MPHSPSEAKLGLVTLYGLYTKMCFYCKSGPPKDQSPWRYLKQIILLVGTQRASLLESVSIAQWVRFWPKLNEVSQFLTPQLHFPGRLPRVAAPIGEGLAAEGSCLLPICHSSWPPSQGKAASHLLDSSAHERKKARDVKRSCGLAVSKL